ncbi:hypothetical protein [Mycetocola sp. 2940]|uniref:hypothetical protein n=1 Tax=Mycetocola sp. 2940 TaxID=3156452 RepID=UPI003393A264
MGYSQRYVFRQAATALLVVTALSGCASQGVDGVLWRQVAAFKDPFSRSLVNTLEITPVEDLAGGIRDGSLLAGVYWDGEARLDSIALEDGGLVIHDLKERTGGLSFDVLLSSGPRDAAADNSAGSKGLYFGPPSVYACSELTIDFEPRPRWGWTDQDCERALTERLAPGGQVVSINEFDG